MEQGKAIGKINWRNDRGVLELGYLIGDFEMTRPNMTKHYPQAFLDIAELLSKDKTAQVRLEFEDAKALQSFRLDLYSFKTAALKEGLDQMWPEIAAITTTRTENTLVVLHKDYTPDALRLAAAVEAAKAKLNGKGE